MVNPTLVDGLVCFLTILVWLGFDNVGTDLDWGRRVSKKTNVLLLTRLITMRSKPDYVEFVVL